MSVMKQRIHRYRMKLRKIMNHIFGKFRRLGLNDTNFTIISNNCWGGVIYEYYDILKNSPTVGMYFFAEEYIRFISNLKYYLNLKLCIPTIKMDNLSTRIGHIKMICNPEKSDSLTDRNG